MHLHTFQSVKMFFRVLMTFLKIHARWVTLVGPRLESLIRRLNSVSLLIDFIQGRKDMRNQSSLRHGSDSCRSIKVKVCEKVVCLKRLSISPFMIWTTSTKSTDCWNCLFPSNFTGAAWNICVTLCCLHFSLTLHFRAECSLVINTNMS